MIILDTNVVSEPLAGVAALPAGRRCTKLSQALTEQVLPLFEGRVLAFDMRPAHAFVQVHAGVQAAGNPISFAGPAIAAIASAHGYAVATRIVRDFKGTGVEVIDPWLHLPAR